MLPVWQYGKWKTGSARGRSTVPTPSWANGGEMLSPSMSYGSAVAGTPAYSQNVGYIS